MSKSYDYSKTWVTEAEAQELHLEIGGAIEVLSVHLAGVTDYAAGVSLGGALAGLRRAREIASLLVTDLSEHDEEV